MKPKYFLPTVKLIWQRATDFCSILLASLFIVQVFHVINAECFSNIIVFMFWLTDIDDIEKEMPGFLEVGKV